jgi:hypothetical protein
VTRPQSPIQITALGIIALLPSKERHARQHHEPARAPEKSIEPAHVPPFRPRSVQPSFCVGCAPQKLLFRLLALASLKPCLAGSRPAVSATLTTIAFDDSSLRWLEINT